MMNFTDGVNNAGIKLKEALLEEGLVDAKVINIEIVKNVNSKFGQNDAIDVSYEVTNSTSIVVFKERIFLSKAKNSKCVQFANELYEGKPPKQINLKEHEGRKCILTIQHNKDEVGNIYDNIMVRKFI